MSKDFCTSSQNLLKLKVQCQIPVCDNACPTQIIQVLADVLMFIQNERGSQYSYRFLGQVGTKSCLSVYIFSNHR